MDEQEIIDELKTENQILKNQLLIFQNFIPKPIGEAEPEEYKYEIERLTRKRLENKDRYELQNECIRLYSLLDKMREKLQIQRQYNMQGWRGLYFEECAEKNILSRNFLKAHKLAVNRGKFVDWVLQNYEDIAKKYIGFGEL